MEEDHQPNALINETSPYLLQHAYNPVHWMPWGDAAFVKAQEEDKLVIISIGYSACHWCHVMERESFEDSTAAALMNSSFVSVKVDREERPDVDQIYMTAVQLMTRQGGWPLNVICLPDGRPVWGGTYFPRDNWMNALKQLRDLYAKDRDQMLDYAARLTEGVRQSELVTVNTEAPDFSVSDATALFESWKSSLDPEEGGPRRAPKFPLPNNYEFLLQYGHLAKDVDALNHLRLSLKKMAHGGIYDQVGGGFARYSTDALWKVPHFEKMLYDNAQLISLYSKAYQKYKDPLYANVVRETLEWSYRELSGPDGEFYSALDADSEGEEGKFYIWTEEELKAIIPESEWEDFQGYYDLEKGLWEHNNIIVLRSDLEPEDGGYSKSKVWKQLLLKERDKRVRPGLDDKSLTSWNGLMITGLLDAYKAFGEAQTEALNRAETNARWMLKNQAKKGGRLLHSYKKGKSSIEGLIEDYAFAIQAFLDLFEVTAHQKYLDQATEWMEYAHTNFEDTATGLFYMRNLNTAQLIAKSLETVDNVIPSSNSVMAKNLLRLGHYLDRSDYREQALHMLNQVDKERLLTYGESYSNWAQLLLQFTYPYYEVAISGEDAALKYGELQQHYLPNIVWIHADSSSKLPLLEDRHIKGSTRIYVCQDKVCQLPVEQVDKALDLLKAVR